jgi:hypothetical protein
MNYYFGLLINYISDFFMFYGWKEVCYIVFLFFFILKDVYENIIYSSINIFLYMYKAKCR